MTLPPHPAPLEPTCDLDQVVILIAEAAEAAGADTAAIEAVPTEVLRQALLRRGGATS